jgi:hypothetical protein
MFVLLLLRFKPENAPPMAECKPLDNQLMG